MTALQEEHQPAVKGDRRWDCFGVPVDLVGREEGLRRVMQFISEPNGQWVATLNPEIIYAAWHDQMLAGALRRATLSLADGIGVVWANRLLGGPLRERVTGVDLLENCLAECAAQSWPVYLLGAVPGVAAEAARRAAGRWPGLPVVGTYHGYFGTEDDERVLRSIEAAAPRLIAVGMGHPKQEAWLSRNMPRLRSSVGLACGGSIDVLAGKVRRAPAWVRQANVEWLYRVLAAPRVRLRRSAVLFAFGYRMVGHRMRGRGSNGAKGLD